MTTLEQWRNGLSKTETWSIAPGDVHNLLDCACDQLDARDAEISALKAKLREVEAEWNKACDLAASMVKELAEARSELERIRTWAKEHWCGQCLTHKETKR